MDIISLFKVVLQKWKVIALVTIITTVFAYFMTTFLPDRYRSSAQISTGFTTQDNLNFVESSFGYHMGVETRFNNLIHTIGSQQVLYSFAYQLILHDLKNQSPFHRIKQDDIVLGERFKNRLIDEFQVKLDSTEILSKNIVSDRVLDSILTLYSYDIEQIQKNLNVWRSPGTDFINVEFYSDSPQLSAYGVNTIVSEILKYNKRLLLMQNEETINFYEVLVANAKDKLTELNQRLERIKKQNQIYDLDALSESKLDLLTTSQLEKEKIESGINAIELEVSEIEERMATLSQKKDIIKNDRVLELRKQISLLNEEYINTGMNNEVLLDSINLLRKNYSDEINRIEGMRLSQSNIETLTGLENKKFDLETKLIIEKSNLMSVEDRIQNTQANISNITSKEPVVNELIREIEFTNKEYLSLQDKLNSVKNQALVSGYNLRQTQFGEPSDKPEGSKKVAFLILGFMSGLAISTFSIMGLALFDQTLKAPDKFIQMTGLKLLGVLTKINLKNYDLSALFSNLNSKNEHLGFFKESMRNIRLEISKMKYKTIMVNSTESNEGKSLFIMVLAIYLSLIKKRILIVDTNFKNSVLTKVLLPSKSNKSNEPKFVNSKKSKSSSDTEEQNDNIVNNQFFERFITNTKFKGVDIIGSLPGSNSPFEIFIERRFDMFTRNISNTYDFIFLEGPALNYYSDTKELIDYCDGVISIFPATKTLSKLDKDSIGFYKDLGDKHIGSVLDFVSLDDLK